MKTTKPNPNNVSGFIIEINVTTKPYQKNINGFIIEINFKVDGFIASEKQNIIYTCICNLPTDRYQESTIDPY